MMKSVSFCLLLLSRFALAADLCPNLSGGPWKCDDQSSVEIAQVEKEGVAIYTFTTTKIIDETAKVVTSKSWTADGKTRKTEKVSRSHNITVSENTKCEKDTLIISLVSEIQDNKMEVLVRHFHDADKNLESTTSVKFGGNDVVTTSRCIKE